MEAMKQMLGDTEEQIQDLKNKIDRAETSRQRATQEEVCPSLSHPNLHLCPSTVCQPHEFASPLLVREWNSLYGTFGGLTHFVPKCIQLLC